MMDADRKPKLLGPWMSMAMVVGYMIGSAIFLLPATLAPFGRNVLRLGRDDRRDAVPRLGLRPPRSPDRGGPQGYMEQAFGPNAAYFTMWIYWISVITSTAAIAVAFGGAVSRRFRPVRPGLGRALVAGGHPGGHGDQPARRAFRRRVPGGHDPDQAASAARRDAWCWPFDWEAAARPNRLPRPRDGRRHRSRKRADAVLAGRLRGGDRRRRQDPRSGADRSVRDARRHGRYRPALPSSAAPRRCCSCPTRQPPTQPRPSPMPSPRRGARASARSSPP